MDTQPPERLPAHKQQLVTNAFLYANDYVCRAKSIPNRQVCRCIPNRRIHPPVLQTQYHWQSGLYLGVAFKECLFDTELKAAQDYDIFLRWWWSTANRGK